MQSTVTNARLHPSTNAWVQKTASGCASEMLVRLGVFLDLKSALSSFQNTGTTSST